MLGLVVHFDVIEGKQAEFEAVLGEVTALVRKNEPGCELYSLARKRGSHTQYAMIERFRDDAALATHQSAAYAQNARPRIDACLASKPTVEWLDVIE